MGCSRALLWHFQMGLKVPLHQSGCIPPRSNQDTGSTTNMGPPGMTISSYTHFGQFGPNWGLPGAPQAPKSGPRRKKMWALCSSIITKSIKTNETVSAMKNNHGTKSSKYWPTPHCVFQVQTLCISDQMRTVWKQCEGFLAVYNQVLPGPDLNRKWHADKSWHSPKPQLLPHQPIWSKYDH